MVHALPEWTRYTAKAILAAPFAFHGLNGVRHLLWDSGKCMYPRPSSHAQFSPRLFRQSSVSRVLTPRATPFLAPAPSLPLVFSSYDIHMNKSEPHPEALHSVLHVASYTNNKEVISSPCHRPNFATSMCFWVSRALS